MHDPTDRPVDKGDIQRVRELVEGIRVAMLTTVEPDGALRSRPMLAQGVDPDGDVWFYTNEGSAKVSEIEQDTRAGVVWSRPTMQRWVSASGTCSVVRNRAKIAELWSPTFRAWFPEGLEDPHLVLLRVRLLHVEYWETPARGVAQAVGLVKALVRGDAIEPAAHTHGRIELRPSAIGPAPAGVHIGTAHPVGAERDTTPNRPPHAEAAVATNLADAPVDPSFGARSAGGAPKAHGERPAARAASETGASRRKTAGKNDDTGPTPPKKGRKARTS